MIWRTTTVNRIVKNKVYIGVQHHKFHEPDPSNPLPSRKRKNRVLLTEFDVQTPHTRIIDDELFLRVNKIFEEKTPLPLAVTFPLSGRFGNFHQLEYVRAGRTKKIPPGKGGIFK